MGISKSRGSSGTVFQTFPGAYGDTDYTQSKRLSEQAEGRIGGTSAFATPLEQMLLNPSYGPSTTAETNLINSLLDLTSGRTATRGLGAPTQTAMGAAIAPTLVDLRNQQIQNLLGAQSAETQVKETDLRALMELIGYAMPQLMGGTTSAERSTGISMSSQCWVAREVYGSFNPDWIIFRDWMLNDSPGWFRRIYLKYGEKFAKFIKNKPKLKKIIRFLMDSRIK